MRQELPRPANTIATVRKIGVLSEILFLLGGILGIVPGVIKDEKCGQLRPFSRSWRVLPMRNGSYATVTTAKSVKSLPLELEE